MHQQIQRSAGDPIAFTLVLYVDGVTGAPGVTPSVVAISRDGDPFQAPAGSVSEAGFGSYTFHPAGGDDALPGLLLLHVEAPDCMPKDVLVEVLEDDGSPVLVQGATAHPLPFLMILAADHIAGVPGVTPGVLISKAGSPFVLPAGGIVEVGYGWYKLLPHAADRDIAGALAIHALAPACDPTDYIFDLAEAPAPDIGPPTPGGPSCTPAPSARPPVTPFLSDSCSGADGASIAGHTPEVGGAWTFPQAGAIAFSAGFLRSDAAATAFAISPILFPTPIFGVAYRMEATLCVRTLTGRAGITVRGDDTGFGAYWGGYDGDTHEWFIRQGPNTVLASIPALLVEGQGYRIMIHSDEQRVVFLVDDQIVLASYHGSVSPAYVGFPGVAFSGLATAATGLHLDNLFGASVIIVATTVSDIMLALRQRLMDRGLFADHQIGLSLDLEPFPFVTPQCLIQPGAQYAEDRAIDGLGERHRERRGAIVCHFLGQSTRDTNPMDTLRLTFPTPPDYGDPAMNGQDRGLLRRLEDMDDDQDIGFLTDVWGNHITTEPVRYGNQQNSQMYGKNPNAFYCGVPVEFQVRYYRRLNRPIVPIS